MYTRGKYVFGKLHDGSYAAVCCNEVANHTAIAPVFREAKSAGFFHVSADGCEVVVSVYGESVGLKLKANPDEDLLWVRRTLGLDPF